MVNDETREESPFQVYINMYCSECADSDCIVCKDIKVLNRNLAELKKIEVPKNNSEDFIIYININDEVRNIIYKCIKIRQINENKYK